jgi:hypothetical protein
MEMNMVNEEEHVKYHELEDRVAQCEKINSLLIQSVQTLTDAYNSMMSDITAY